jgi:hypothetical protein
LKRFATICNFGKLNLEKDTIPKPGGLGSDGPRSGLSCPVVVRLPSGLRPVHVDATFGGVCEITFRTFSVG